MTSLTYTRMRFMSCMLNLPLYHLSLSNCRRSLNQTVSTSKFTKANRLYSNMSYKRNKVLSPSNYCYCGDTIARKYSVKIARFTLRNETYRQYLASLEQEYKALNEAQVKGERLRKDQRARLHVLGNVTDIFEVLKVKYEELEELDKMQHDDEMKDLAAEEKRTCLQEIEELEEKLEDVVCPDEHIDECDIILEVESGAGGQEAMLFAAEVFEMYQNYAETRGWQFDITNLTNSDEGIRKVSAAVSGQGVFGEMKYEGGVHRVQRIPKTESKGRVHTSTISVAVLPQPTEVSRVKHSGEGENR